jgi:calcineurin-like phosphoesterase family protein
MNEKIINNFLLVLKKGDILNIAGDLAWDDETAIYFFNQIPRNIKVHWIKGNHDKTMDKVASRFSFVETHLMLETKIQGNHVTICHYPMLTWNKSHYNSWQLFGHHHTDSHGWEGILERTSGKQMNINCEFNNFFPFSEDEVVAYMNSKEDNWDLIKKN